MATVPYVGDTLETTWDVTVAGVPTDPESVTLTFWPGPNEPPTVWVLGGSGSVDHVGVGVFSAQFESTAPGMVTVMWEGEHPDVTSVATTPVQSKPTRSPVTP
jgi:hypothetical protein